MPLTQGDRSDARAATEGFLNRCIAELDRVPRPWIEVSHQIGPWHVRQRHLSPATVGPFTAAFRHLPDPGAAAVDLTLSCIDVATSGFDLGAPPWRVAMIGSMGVIDGLQGTPLRAMWDYQRKIIHVLDLATGRGLVITECAADLPGWEQTFPLRTHLHWMSAEAGMTLLHAGAVGTEHAGALIVGAGGSGKSTTTLACTRAGLRMAGDDFVLVEPGPPPRVHGLYATAKLAAQSTAWFTELAGHQTFDIGPEFEKNVFMLDALGAQRMAINLPVSMIVRLRQTGGAGSSFEPTSPGEIFRAAAPNTLGLLYGDRAGTLARLAEVSRLVPSFLFNIGTDLDGVGPAMARKLAEVSS